MNISTTKNSNKLTRKFDHAELSVYPEDNIVRDTVIDLSGDFTDETIISEEVVAIESPVAIFTAKDESESFFKKIKNLISFKKTNITISVNSKTLSSASIKFTESENDIITSSYRSDISKIFPKILGTVEIEVGQNTASSLLSSFMFGVEFFKDVDQALKFFQLQNGVSLIQISTSVESKNVNHIVDFELKNHNHIIWVSIFSQKIIPLLARKMTTIGGKITGYHQRKMTSNKNFFTIMVTHEKIMDQHTTPAEPVMSEKQKPVYVAKVPMEL